MRTTDPRETEALREQALDLLHQFAPIDLQANELRALIAVLQPIARRVEKASVPRRLRAVEPETKGDGPAQTWRDLADQLKPEQITYLEKWEQRPEPTFFGPPALDRRQAMLGVARGYIDSNDAAKRYADVPTPPGAKDVGGWDRWSDDEYRRQFDGTVREVGPVKVLISGHQDHHGRVVRDILIEGEEFLEGGFMPVEQARVAAEMVLEAVDEIDQLDS